MARKQLLSVSRRCPRAHRFCTVAHDRNLIPDAEVISLLGSTKDCRVVELGAGIGRFTAEIAPEATSVIALDFMQNLIDQNKISNGHLGNIDFRCGDATQLSLPPASADVVFSNWLLMYLSDAEVEKLAQNMLTWLDEDGIIFFRESCFRQSGDKSRSNNPTHYRNPRQYFEIFDKTKIEREDGGYDYFELIVCKSIDTYAKVKQNQNQVCWKWRKTSAPGKASSSNDLRYFLDRQYSIEGISRYQMMFGDGFVSPGGITTTKEYAKMLGVSADDSVLDIGCGIGGAAFHISTTYGCFVHGLDLSVNMIMGALEASATSQAAGCKASFEVSDAEKREYGAEVYDAVFSRDVFLYVKDKEALLNRIWRCLKPGGRLVFTDYCGSDRGAYSDAFGRYVSEKAFNLASVGEYEAMIARAGFGCHKAEVVTDKLIEVTEAEISNLDGARDELIVNRSMSTEQLDNLKTSWENRLQFAKDGEHSWMLFYAQKSYGEKA